MAHKMYMSKRYETHEWEDETSAFDPKGRWQPGAEFYEITLRARVPKKLLQNAKQTDNFDPVVEDGEATDCICESERNTTKPICLSLGKLTTSNLSPSRRQQCELVSRKGKT